MSADNAFPALLFNLVHDLVQKGVALTIELQDGAVVAVFNNGFYKSDGAARLQELDGDVLLFTRYGHVKIAESVEDVVDESFYWYEVSKLRYEGFKTPPDAWRKLYTEFNLGGV